MLQVLPQGTVILQPPPTATSSSTPTVSRGGGVVPQPQVVLINSAALQPQLIVPTGQVRTDCYYHYRTLMGSHIVTGDN